MGPSAHSGPAPTAGMEGPSEGHAWGSPRGAGALAFPSSALPGTHILPGRRGSPGGHASPPGPRRRRRGRCSRDPGPPPRWGSAAPRSPPPRRARGRRALPARRAAGAPPASAARTPSAAPLRCRRAPAWAGPRRGEAPAHLERRRQGGEPRWGDRTRQPPPERPFRGLCLRCHMGRGAGFKRVSAGHAVSGAPQPCPQRQRSARPGMRL